MSQIPLRVGDVVRATPRHRRELTIVSLSVPDRPGYAEVATDGSYGKQWSIEPMVFVRRDNHLAGDFVSVAHPSIPGVLIARIETISAMGALFHTAAGNIPLGESEMANAILTPIPERDYLATFGPVEVDDAFRPTGMDDIAGIRNVLHTAGYGFLTDADVTDMGDYVLVKNPKADCVYYPDSGPHMRKAVEAGASYWDAYDRQEHKARRSMLYLGKQLRVEAWTRLGQTYQQAGFGLVHYHVVNGQQMRTVSRKEGQKVTSQVVKMIDARLSFTEGTAFITKSQFSPMERGHYLLQVIHSASESGRLSGDKAAALRAKVATLIEGDNRPPERSRFTWIGTGQLYNETPQYRGHYSYRSGATMSAFKKMGEFVSLAKNATREQAEAFMAWYTSARNGDVMPGSKLDKGIYYWNCRASSEHQLHRADCGHYHLGQGHTTREGTVCSACLSEHYVFLEDMQMHGQRSRAYFHTGGNDAEGAPEAWYSYRDPLNNNQYAGGDLSNWGASTAGLMHDRSFKPSTQGDFTMGIELEVESPNARRSSVAECDKHFNKKGRRNYAMFKSDGSLGDGGFEIVTAARRVNDHVAIFKEWEPKNMKAWNGGRCGMHLHIDSAAFTPLSFGKFLMLYNDPENAEFIRSIAGRHPAFDSQAERYAKAIDSGKVKDPHIVKTGDNNSRYFMVNLTNITESEQNRLGLRAYRESKGNYSTIELRIFRATLRKERLLAQIEFGHASVVFCRQASYKNLNEKAFKEWLATTAAYPHLTQWMGTSRARNKNYLKAGVMKRGAEAAEV